MEKRKKILVCDDELGVREAYSLILSKDYALDFATTADEAVEKVKIHKYAGVIMDIKMPKKNGLEALTDIKTISPELKVLIVTGYQSIDTAMRAIKLGAVDYMTKPFESIELLRKIQDITE